MDVSNLDIQHIDEDEASEDLSVVEREVNDDYQPKSVRIKTRQRKKSEEKILNGSLNLFKYSALTGTGIQLWW